MINQFLASKGISPIPVDEETISTIITAIIGLYVAYKDNPTSKEGKQANTHMKQLKAQKNLTNSTGKAPVTEDEGNL